MKPVKCKPVEFCFRKCVIKRNYNSSLKYVSVEGLPGAPNPEIIFDASQYDVGETFYAYLMPNKFFSGSSDDDKFTLTNMNSFHPFLRGKENIGMSLSNCGSGGSKPPKGIGTSTDKRNKPNNEITKEIASNFKIAKKTHQDLKYKNVIINDFGSPVVVFSKHKIHPWQRIESIPLHLPSKNGLIYTVYNRESTDFEWTCD